MKQKLALGNQEFSKVINNNCIYVDKTEKWRLLFYLHLIWYELVALIQTRDKNL